MTREELREKIADLQHQLWVDWMEYLFDQCLAVGDGRLEIPKWAVDRWTRQMHTPYKDLPNNEQESDRHVADKVLSLFDGLRGG